MSTVDGRPLNPDALGKSIDGMDGAYVVITSGSRFGTVNLGVLQDETRYAYTDLDRDALERLRVVVNGVLGDPHQAPPQGTTA